jgi:hypothetical protein
LRSLGIDGQIPESIGDLNHLAWLDLSGNNFTGEIPSSIGNLELLVYLSLENNMISGSIPSSLGYHSSPIRYIYLNNNKLSGEIPVSLGYLYSLYHLDLENNHLSGLIIPISLGDLPSISYLSLGNNQFIGEIPTLPGLIDLNITGTALYFAHERSATRPGSIETVRAEPTEIPDLNGNGEAKFINLIIIVAGSFGAIYLAVVLGVLVLIAWRGAKNKREKRDNHALVHAARTNLYEMSVLAGNTEQTGSELVFISLISSGAFGEVWKGIHRGEIVAIKKMKLERMPNDQLQFIQSVLTEAKTMRDMTDDRVVQFISFDFRNVSIIMELMPQGALSTFIAKSKNTMKWSTRYQMMLDICEGMAFLHSATYADGSAKKELFHQDLKSANVLLIEVDGIIRAKIGDFGLSRMILII